VYNVVEDLLGQMTEQEKVAMLVGTNGCYTVPTQPSAIGPLRLSAQQIGLDDAVQMSVDVTNTGQHAGKEVVQSYVRDEQALLLR
jgi:hypothetical protein